MPIASILGCLARIRGYFDVNTNINKLKAS